MMTVVKKSNVELRKEIIRKYGDLKSVRQTFKDFEIANEGGQMIKSGDDVSSYDKSDPELTRFSRLGRYSSKNLGPNLLADHCRYRPCLHAPSAETGRSSTRKHSQLQVGDALNVDI